MGKRQKKKREQRSVAGATAKRREKAGQGFSDMFNLPKGTEMFGLDSAGVKRVDIVPYTVGDGNPNAEKGSFYWERTFFAHRGIGVNNDWVVCPARTAKQPCPICELMAKMQKDAKADEDAVKALAPSKRMLVNVRDLKKDADKIKVWHISHWYFGKAIDEALAAAYEDHEDNMDNFCDPEGGHYLKIVAETGFEGQGYQVSRVDFVSRKEDLGDEILEQAVCLDDVLNIKSYKELKDMLYAGQDKDDEDEDDDEKPVKGKTKPVDEDDEDEDDEDDVDEDDEDDDDDDEEKPAKGKKGKTKPVDDDNEEDAEDDEDDDEDDDDEDDDNTEDDDDEDDDNEEDAEDDEDDDEDDEDDDDEDEDEKPAKGKKGKTTRRKVK